MGKRLGIALVLLAILLVVADRGGQLIVQRIVAGELQDNLRTPGKPDVDIAGIPFLPQLISRDFDKVTFSARNADAGGVVVERIEARLRGVTQAGKGAKVDRISGEGLIRYEALTAVAKPAVVSYGGDGLVKVARTIGGIDATASARPKIVGDELVIKAEKVGSSLTGETAVAGLPTINVKLRDIPKNLSIDIEPTAKGVEFTFSGKNVLFVSSPPGAAAGSSLAPAFPLGLGVRAARPVGSGT